MDLRRRPARAISARGRASRGPSFSGLTRERSLLRATPRPSGAASLRRPRPPPARRCAPRDGVLGGLGHRATLGEAATDGVPGRANTLGGAVELARHLRGPTAARLLDGARDALLHGLLPRGPRPRRW